MVKIMLQLVLSISLYACAQTPKNNASPSNNNNNKTEDTMDLSKISNEKVRKAIEALQASDKNAWYAFFTNDAVFTDDGNTLDFKSFFDNAFSQKEKFLAIDKAENEGKDIYGDFYAGQWGTFKVYFKFHQNTDGKFNRIDIGQVSRLK